MRLGCRHNFAVQFPKKVKQMSSRGMKSRFWRSFHKWAGVVFALFMVIFCISGIILNHRKAFARCDVSRSWLPDQYAIRNYNNGIIRGTERIDSLSLLAYGSNGVWLTDSGFSSFSDYNRGLPQGTDNRNVKRVVTDSNGRIWCATTYGVYRHDGDKWTGVCAPSADDRMADIALDADGDTVVAMTRSGIYRFAVGSGDGPEYIELQPIAGREVRYSLFKTVWQLHSGELFGIAGRIVVDAIAVVIIFLSLSGIVIFVCPSLLRRRRSKRLGKMLKWNWRWHDRMGYYPLVLTLLVAVTGMCLRPPLMIPFVMVKTAPLAGSAMDSDNYWHDSLRGIRWDADRDCWLLSTTEGFATVDKYFKHEPALMSRHDCPPISPMGINVMERIGADEWLIGSFSGLYGWNLAAGEVNAVEPESLVSGHSMHLDAKKPVVFDYVTGASEQLPQSQAIESSPMSLWNFALELHVGRCYTPFLGPLSALFVFIFGLALTLILISGYIVSRRMRKKKNF